MAARKPGGIVKNPVYGLPKQPEYEDVEQPTVYEEIVAHFEMVSTTQTQCVVYTTFACVLQTNPDARVQSCYVPTEVRNHVTEIIPQVTLVYLYRTSEENTKTRMLFIQHLQQ